MSEVGAGFGVCWDVGASAVCDYMFVNRTGSCRVRMDKRTRRRRMKTRSAVGNAKNSSQKAKMTYYE